MQRSVGGAGAAGGRISNNRPLSSSRTSQRRRQSPNSSSGEGGASKSRRVEQPTLKPPPPPPSFKPPPLPDEDEDVFIRPIGRSRSPNLQVPPAPPVSLSPIGEVDTPESSRSVSPCSMMSQSSSSSRAYSPAPFVISHDTFMKPTTIPTDGQPSWRRTSPARKLSPSLPEAGAGAPQPAVLKPVQNIETARVEGSKPVRKDTPAIIPRMEIAPATPLQVARQKENAEHSRIQEEEQFDNLDFDDVQKSSNFSDIDGKFTGSNFKRRQSKKFKLNRAAESHPVQETLKVPNADSLSHLDEDYDLESKNLTPKEEYVIKEVLNARRSRSRSPNTSEASLSTDTSSAEPKVKSSKSDKPSKSSTNATVKQDAASVKMTSTVRVEEKSGEIFVPDCVENIADLTVEHVKYMADKKLMQAQVGELGDYFDVPPVKPVEIPQVVIDKAETKEVNRNMAKANINATALVGDVEKMYEDVDPRQFSPLPQPKQVHPKNIDNSFTKANATPKDVAVTDLYDEAMEVEEVEFEAPRVKTAKEEKITANMYKVEQQPHPGLVTDIYEQTEIANERTPDERFNEYEAVMRNVSEGNKAKAARAPKDALVGDIHDTFETATEQPVKNGVASASAAAKSEPNRLTKAQKTAANTVGLGAENNVTDNFEEPGRLANTDIASPKVAQNKRVKSSLRKASSSVRDTSVTELNDQFMVTEEAPVTADKVYTTVPSVVTSGYATVANNSEQVALYEDIDQPKPRTKKKPAVQPTKAEVTSQPELARASTTAVSPKIQPPIRSSSQQPKLAARVVEPPQPPRRSASTHQPDRSWTRDMDSKETKAVSKTTTDKAQNSSIFMWLLPSLLGFLIYWLFKMFLEKNVKPPEPIHEELEDYSYFNILRWP